MFPNQADDAAIQKLLYACCEWYALAKLRLHTDQTLSLLENATTVLGASLRRFANDLCPKYATTESDREVAGRKRRARRKAANEGRTLESKDDNGTD
jgi:hypothetical protein